jgi:hypothetical protein
MSSVRAVPETELMSGEELSADDAWHTVRRYGLGHLLATAFVRFRYGDGFSHARAFGLQLALAAVPRRRRGGRRRGRDGRRRCRGRHRRGARRARRGRRRARAAHRVRRGDIGVRTAGTRREPDLRHEARPPRTAQVRPRRAADGDGRRRTGRRPDADRGGRTLRPGDGGGLPLGRRRRQGVGRRPVAGRARRARPRRHRAVPRAAASPGTPGSPSARR